MKKILFCILGCLIVLPARTDNIATTKPYVDYNVNQKQYKIPGIPSDYTPVEYIQATAAGPYINTGLTISQSDEIRTKFSKDGSGTYYVFGATSSGHTASVTGYLSGGGYWRWGNQYVSIAATTGVHTAILNATSLTYDGTVYAMNSNTTFTTPVSLTIGAGHTYNNAYNNKLVGKIYSFQILDGNRNLRFNGIPARYNDVCGLYDTVSGTFKSSPSGSFTCGPEGIGAIVTYGASNGNIESTVIVDDLSYSNTTESTVPTTGAVVVELNDKMKQVTANANFVMAGEAYNSDGTMQQKKPVYYGTFGENNYDRALVTAGVVNNSSAAAANNELSCVDNDCTLWQIGSATTITTTCKNAGSRCLGNSECCNNDCSITGQCGAVAVFCSTNRDCPAVGGLQQFCCDGRCQASVCDISTVRCKSDKDCSPREPYCCNGICQSFKCL